MLAPSRKPIHIVGPLQIHYVLCSVWQAAKWPSNIYLTLEAFQTFSELLVKKKKKKRGWGWGRERREKGYLVAQHPGDLDFNSHFLSRPILEKLLRQLFSVACCLVAIQQWPLHKSTVVLMRTKLQIPSQSSKMIKMEGGSPAVCGARNPISESKHYVYVSIANVYYYLMSLSMCL